MENREKVIKARFDAKWRENPDKTWNGTPCWEWIGALIGKGYGQFQVRPNKDKNAHRWAWRIYRGRLLDEDRVLHHCDNPRCVNPNHLFVGSSSDNAQDMKSKGRHLFGERNAKSKLTANDVIEMHNLSKDGMSTYKIAGIFGVHQTIVSRILRGERWEHLYKALANIRKAAE